MRNFLRDPRDQNSAAKTGEELSVCVNQSRSMKFCLAVLAAAKSLPIMTSTFKRTSAAVISGSRSNLLSKDSLTYKGPFDVRSNARRI